MRKVGLTVVTVSQSHSSYPFPGLLLASRTLSSQQTNHANYPEKMILAKKR
jgi:hypothetical protein